MDIFVTIGEPLLPWGAVVHEGIVSKVAVFCIVVLNFDKMVGCELFKASLALMLLLLELFVMWICWRPKQLSTKTVAVLYCWVVNLPFSWATKPGCVGINWSTNTTGPGLVCLNTCWLGLLPLVCHSTFVAAPKRQLTYCGGVVFARFFGISHSLPILLTG